MTVSNYIAIAALLVSVFMMIVNTTNITKNNKEKADDNTKEEVAQQTGIMLALNNIEKQLTRIENEINTVKQDNKENHDKIIIIEQSYKSEHKRLDEHAERLNAIEQAIRIKEGK